MHHSNEWVAVVKMHNDPFVMATDYLQILAANRGEGTQSYLICEALSKFPQESFLRWGDKNWLKDVSRSWFSDNGVEIDVQCEVISEAYGVEIWPQDIIDHVLKYKPGQYKKPLQDELEAVISRFQNLFGFRITPGYAKFLGNLKLESDVPF